MKDTLYAQQHTDLVDFVFDEQVAAVFADMIGRSVPGYGTVISVAGLLAQEYAQSKSQLYDLGCSLGAATLSMRRAITQTDCRIIAVDNAIAMIRHCQATLAGDDSRTDVRLVCADLRAIRVVNASVVLLNYTLQFIPLADRQSLLHSIYEGMLPGGVLMLSEKIHFKEAAQQQLHTHLHHAFKRAHGYSDLEISQKRAALERVLISESSQIHLKRLRAAGFSSAEVWFQCFNFASFIALK